MVIHYNNQINYRHVPRDACDALRKDIVDFQRTIKIERSSIGEDNADYLRRRPSLETAVWNRINHEGANGLVWLTDLRERAARINGPAASSF